MGENKDLSTNKSTKSKGGKMAIVHAVLIQMPNVNLNGGMVL
jgi:hypothetical protein